MTKHARLLPKIAGGVLVRLTPSAFFGDGQGLQYTAGGKAAEEHRGWKSAPTETEETAWTSA